MNAPTPAAAAEKLLSGELDVEAAISKLVEQTIPKRPLALETDAERIQIFRCAVDLEFDRWT